MDQNFGKHGCLSKEGHVAHLLTSEALLLTTEEVLESNRQKYVNSFIQVENIQYQDQTEQAFFWSFDLFVILFSLDFALNHEFLFNLSPTPIYLSFCFFFFFADIACLQIINQFLNIAGRRFGIFKCRVSQWYFAYITQKNYIFIIFKNHTFFCLS